MESLLKKYINLLGTALYPYYSTTPGLVVLFPFRVSLFLFDSFSGFLFLSFLLFAGLVGTVFGEFSF